MDGVDSTGGHVALGGAFNVNTSGVIMNGFLDEDDAGQLQSAVSGASGSIATTSTTTTTGRETATYSWSSGSQNHSMNDAIYMVNANEFFIVQIDQLAAGKPITSGRAIATGSSFSASSLSGNYLIHTSGSTAGAANVTLGVLTLTGGNVNGSLTQDNATSGAQTTPIAGGQYAVDSNNSGRVALSGVGSNPPILYLTAPVANTETISAFIIGSDNSAIFGLAEPQPTATYSTSSLSGNFVLGTEDTPDNTGAAYVGMATVSSSPSPGTIALTLDLSSADGVLLGNLVDSETLTINSDGTGGFVGGGLFLITNGTKLFITQVGTGTPPFIYVVEQ